MNEKTFNTRIIHKHDTETNWLKAVNFIPKQGELIIYDSDENYPYQRVKIGDGITSINDLPFVVEVIIDKTLKLENHAADAKITGEKIEELELSVFNIDYNTLLAFDTTEIVIDMSASTSMLGKAILGQMILR